MRANIVLGVGSAALIHAASAIGDDSPGGVVSNRVMLAERWMRNVKALGEVSEAGTALTIPVILKDGSLRLTGGTTGITPPSDLGPVSWAGTTRTVDLHGQDVRPWCIALGRDGRISQWSNRGPGYAPSGASWRQLTVGASNVVGISGDGSMHAWTFTGPLPVNGAVTNAIDVSAGRGWGMSIDSLGRAAPFSIGATPIPAIAPVEGALAVETNSAGAIVATTVDPGRNAAILRNDGSIVSGNGTRIGEGPYRKMAWCGGAQNRLIALRADGNAEIVNAAGVEYLISGGYEEVWGGFGGTPSLDHWAAIWSEDCDGDGEPDAAQIRRGEIPDINGDLIDDRRQDRTVLLDDDGNGTSDAAEVSALGRGFGTSTTGHWYWFNVPSPRREVWMGSMNVRSGSEVVDRAVWLLGGNAASTASGAMLHLWSDPDRDGWPADCVELLAVPVVLHRGFNIIEFPPLRLGEHGDNIFVGLSFITSGSGPSGGVGVVERSTAASPGNRERLSRRFPGFWAGFSADPEVSATNIARRQFESRLPVDAPIWEFTEVSPYYTGVLPHVTLVPSWSLPTDCNADGVLDSLNGLFPSNWTPPLDADGDGRIDTCETDCDDDGIQDLDELLAGSADCDRNLVPDDCDFGKRGPPDCDLDGQPDPCQDDDCDGNGVPDGCDLEGGAPDIDRNGILDACERDCDANGIPDHVQIAQGASDCNLNGWIDACESPDCDGDGIADVCEMIVAGDCNRNGIPDDCDIASGVADWADADGDGRIDQCEYADGSETDCNGNGILDSLEDPAFTDCDGDGQRDLCEADCDDDGVPDACEIASGGARDCDANGIPDSCDISGGAQDSDGDLIIDSCERSRGDLTLDGWIDGGDLGLLFAYWGQSSPPMGDLDEDGVLDGTDLGLMLSRWGPVQW